MSSGFGPRSKRLAASGLVAFGLAVAGGQVEANLSSDATVLAAEDKDKDKDKVKVKDQDLNLAATPELGSLALFSAGAAGMAGYAATKLRGRRPRKRE